MGMFDDKKYLTGQNGIANPGDVFMLHEAHISGTVTLNGKERDEAQLTVTLKDATEKTTCFTSGGAIVSQIQRMESGDLPAVVRLDEKPSKHGQPMRVLTPVEQDIPF